MFISKSISDVAYKLASTIEGLVLVLG